ncbi:MAG TPA: DUF3300 domain-containing protein [Terracidiphilus sp.]|jgi:hypothetical protein|nr:DUF3300 domain-containing protein [Terracidiphilus sp.]
MKSAVLIVPRVLAAGLLAIALQGLNAQSTAPDTDPAPPLSPAVQLSDTPQPSQPQPIQPQGYLKKPTPYHYAAPQPDQGATKPAPELTQTPPDPKPLKLHPAPRHPQTNAHLRVLDNYQPSQPAQTAPNRKYSPPDAGKQSQREYAQVDPAAPQQQSGYPPQQDDPAPGNPYPAPEYSQPQPVYPAPRYAQPQQNYARPQQDYAPPQPQPDTQPGAQPDYDQPDYGSSQPANAPQPLSADQLEQLVAPIALYPDALLAQILTASTYPAQISAADQWLSQMNGAAPQQIAEGANQQTSWDPSVKALTAFPQVLEMLDGNLQWTTSLGNAYYNQPQDVMDTVQVMRQRAEQAGNLETTPQEQVIQQPNEIEVQPANPDYVYVPSYNPWYAYGEPIAPYPSFDFGNSGLYIGSGIEYGLGFAMDPFLRFPFGMASWGCDWLGGAILFDNAAYWTHSGEMRDWGFAHGGQRWDGGRGWGGRGGYGGRNTPRFGDYHHQGIQTHSGGGLPHAYGGPQRPIQGRGEQRFGGEQANRRGEQRFGNGQQPRFGNGGNGFRPVGPQRPEMPRQQAYGRTPEAFGRPQPYGGGPRGFAGGPQPIRPEQFRTQPGGPGRAQPYAAGPGGFGSRPSPYRTQPEPSRQFSQAPRGGNSFGYARPGQGYAGGPASHAAPYQGYHSPQPGYGRPGFGGGNPYGGSRGGGQSFARPPQSGGFHPFGGGHSSPSFGGGGGHSFGGGSHSFGGGGGHFGGGGHSFSGGGHSFGGGGHSGGGHSGGGHHR